MLPYYFLVEELEGEIGTSDSRAAFIRISQKEFPWLFARGEIFADYKAVRFSGLWGIFSQFYLFIELLEEMVYFVRSVFHREQITIWYINVRNNLKIVIISTIKVD